MAERNDFGVGWSLRANEDQAIPGPVLAALPIPATVPGTVHTDLLAAGLIPDPYHDNNEADLEWIGHVDWIYERTYHHSPVDGEQLTLSFDGLDTVATVSINDEIVLQSANQHRRYDVRIDTALRPGDNRVTVRFDSPIATAQAEVDRLGDLPRNYPHPYNFIRKSACNFGWDWGPALVTSGIWRDVTLVRTTDRRIVSASPATTIDQNEGVVHVDLELGGPGNQPVEIETRVGSVTTVAVADPSDNHLQLEVRLPDVQRWWPRDLGDPHLYDISVRVISAGVELDRWDGRIGFRTFRLDTTHDTDGMPFVFVVNDVALPIRGVNWIPDDCFVPQVTTERVRERISQAVEANVNLMRIWGGGVYESHDFYQACDEAGLLVWQDFLFACAAYSEDEPQYSEVEAEARDNVNRLRPHPSLVLWNGNNENFEGYVEWGWQEPIGDRGWGPGFYLDLLPRVIADADPTRVYWPGSPYSGTQDIHPNDNDHGPRHIWDAWNKKDYSVYAEHRTRFVAEFGWQGPPTWATLTEAIHDEPLTPDSPGMASHQKADDGQAKLERGIGAHFPKSTTFDDWHYAAQAVQARAITFGVEHFRSLWPFNSGTVLWQLNDCWPVVSWATIDGYGRRKPLWYALRRAYEPRLLTVQPSAGDDSVVAVNDTPNDWATELVMERMAFEGTRLATATTPLRVPAFSTTTVELPAPIRTPDDPSREVVVATADGARTLHYFADDLELALEPAQFSASITRRDADLVVSLTCDTVARDVCLFPDRLGPEGTVDDQFLTMLPGETVVLRVSGLSISSDAALVTSPVLRCANDFLHPSTVEIL